MEWEKMAPWDLGELDQSIDPDVGSVVASSGGLERQIARLDCSVDLKLGGLGDFGSAEKWREQPRPPAAAMLPAYASSKRARAQSSGTQTASCLVEGCGSDLTGCRDYHRRHKVCEAHSKTPVVVVGGQEQRFCQQCSRFHLLAEFDGVKKSCRKRLEGHNKRRRKPRHDSSNSAIMFPNHPGRFSAYPPMFSSAPIEPNWYGILKTEDDGLYPTHVPPMHLFARQHQFPDCSDRSYNEGKQFPFLQDSDMALGSRMTLEPSVCQPLRNTISPVESSNSRMFSGGLTQVFDSDCALSLLSSPTPTSGINMAKMVPADRIPMGQPLASSLQLSGLGRYSHSQASNDVSRTGLSCSGIDDERIGTVLVSDDASDADIHYRGMFHVAGEGSSDGASHALPFSWQ